MLDLRPLCYAHDYCYSCAYTVPDWPTDNRQGALKCDERFNTDGQRLCLVLYGWLIPFWPVGTAVWAVCAAKIGGAYEAIKKNDNRLRTEKCPGQWKKLAPGGYGNKMGFYPEDRYCTSWVAGACWSYGGTEEEKHGW